MRTHADHWRDPATGVLFRLDACAAIGAGHLMRCRSLALALRARGVDASFVLGTASRDAATALADDGFTVTVLPTSELDQLLLSDAAATEEAAAGRPVVVDHYGAGPDYLERLSDAGLAVGVIDDLGDRDLSAARWILNQN